MEMENYTPLYFRNLSTNATWPGDEFDVRNVTILQIINITIYSIISILGIMGNGLVIWIIGCKMEKTATLISFLNLGIADFSFCLFLLLHITEIAHPGYWPFGWIMCKGLLFIMHLNLSASVLFLTIISVDRCICVLYPVWAKIHRTSRLASVISVIIWIISVALSSPYIAFVHYKDYGNGSSYCLPAFDDLDKLVKAMNMIRFISMFLIPFSIILVCYGLIAFQVKTRRIPGSGRILKIIFTIVICFFFCWFLFHILAYADIYIGSTTTLILYNLAGCLACLNSCLNPLIYVFIGQDFQNIFKKSIPFLLERAFRESNDPPEMLNTNLSEMEKMA